MIGVVKWFMLETNQLYVEVHTLYEKRWGGGPRVLSCILSTLVVGFGCNKVCTISCSHMPTLSDTARCSVLRVIMGTLMVMSVGGRRGLWGGFVKPKIPTFRIEL